MLGRSKAVFTAWLNQQIPAFRSSVEIVVMDGLPGFKTAAVEAINKAITAVSCGVSAELPELRKLGRTLRKHRRTSWPTSAAHTRPTGRPRRSTAVSSTSAAPLWAPATWPTTSADPSATPEASNPPSTAKSEEPFRSDQ